MEELLRKLFWNFPWDALCYDMKIRQETRPFWWTLSSSLFFPQKKKSFSVKLGKYFRIILWSALHWTQMLVKTNLWQHQNEILFHRDTTSLVPAPNWSASELKVQRILHEGMALWSIETGWTRQEYSGIRKGTQFRGYRFFHCECLWRSCVTWGSLLWLQLPTEELRLHNDDLQQDGRSTMEDLQALLHSQTATTSVGPWRHHTEHLLGLDFWNTLHFGQLRMMPRPR